MADKDSVDPLYDGLLDEEEDGGGLQFMGPVRDDLMDVENPTAEKETLDSVADSPFSKPFSEKVVTPPKKGKAVLKKTSTSSMKIHSASNEGAASTKGGSSMPRTDEEGSSWKKPVRLSGKSC